MKVAILQGIFVRRKLFLRTAEKQVYEKQILQEMQAGAGENIWDFLHELSYFFMYKMKNIIKKLHQKWTSKTLRDIIGIG